MIYMVCRNAQSKPLQGRYYRSEFDLVASRWASYAIVAKDWFDGSQRVTHYCSIIQFTRSLQI